jgi:hypothetical protein
MSLDALLAAKAAGAAGIDSTRLEDFLLPGDFEKAFGVDAAAFGKLPKWKRDGAKRKAGLY